MPPKKPKSKPASAVMAAKSDASDHDDSNDDNNDDEDVALMWEKLQQTQHKKIQRLEAATEKLQQEKETMEASMMASKHDTQANDVLTINAGGKLITAMRNTLTIPTDSMWAYMFS